MKHVGLVSVGELLLGCLLVASFTMSLTQGQLPHPAAASSSSKRAEVLHSSALAASKPTIAELLSAESDRIAFIKGKLNAGDPEYGQAQSSIQAPLYSGQTIGSANYIVKVGLGTPAKDLYLAIDTGSGLTWTQCLPCGSCYSQKGPIFDPSASSSYKQVPCASAQCTQLSSSASSTCSRAKCDYVIFYLDGSSTVGDFALETLTVGGDAVSTAFPFGCGHQNAGLFYGMDGLMGLSRDTIAFPAQTKAAFGEVFAYCLPPIFSSSAGYIEFGAGSRGPSTPLVELRTSTLYVVELEGIQVEGTRSIAKPPRSKETIVDSGTVITRLDTPLYEQVRDAFKKAASSLKEAPAGAGMGLFDTCYIASATSVFPRITFTFTGGLVFTPGAQTSVILIDDKDTYCLALLPLDSSSGFSIFGNFQQQGHLVTYDIAHSTLSISSNTC